jgi:hypothetical protein
MIGPPQLGQPVAPPPRSRRAATSVALGTLTAVALVSLIFSPSGWLTLLGLMVALVSGATAMTIGGVALSEWRLASLAVRRKAFAGVALGSTLLAAVVFWVLSIAVGLVTTAHAISNPSQFEAQVQQRCVQAEERAGKSQQAATRSCGVDSLGTCSTTPAGYTCSSSSTVLVGISTSRGSWLLGAIVLVGWGGLVLAVFLLLFRRSSQRQEVSHDAR